MKLFIKKFDELTTHELYEILKLRLDVFVVEQKCAYEDIDGKDYDSIHIFYVEKGEIISYLRIFPDDFKMETIHIGRVISRNRKSGYGEILMRSAIEYIKKLKTYDKIYLEAQVYAVGFYEKFGFARASEEFLEDGILHVAMELNI